MGKNFFKKIIQIALRNKFYIFVINIEEKQFKVQLWELIL